MSINSVVVNFKAKAFAASIQVGRESMHRTGSSNAVSGLLFDGTQSLIGFTCTNSSVASLGAHYSERAKSLCFDGDAMGSLN